MFLNNRYIYIGVSLLCTVGLFLGARAVFAQMNSTNYKIQSDSVNVGGIRSSSTNYTIEDTAGEIATGESSSASYKLKAGYQQMQGSSISLTSPADIALSALTINNDSAVGSAAWTVTTDNAAGYELLVNVSTDPALQDSGTGEAFTDYSEATPGVPEQWSVSNAYEFGFSSRGDDVDGYGSDSDCIDTANVPSTTLKWRGFDGTNTIQIASSTARTSESGTASTLCVATEQDTLFAPSGSYSATVTVTAITY